MVFNNPSVDHCHGWKLAEYLCLGKAIISLPLLNNIPFQLNHNEQLYLVENNLKSISKAIDEILENQILRKKLEKNALEYWNNYARPEKIIQYILKKGNV